MPHPPHLPKKQERPVKNLKEFIFFILLTVVVAFFAGVAASSIFSVWFVREVPASRSVFTYFQNKSGAVTPEDILSQDEKNAVGEKIFKLVDTRKKIGELFDGNAFLGNATFFTLDGYAAMSAPNLNISDMDFFEALDSQGRMYKIQKMVKEEETGLVFFQVIGNGFSVLPISNKFFAPQDSVWFLGQNSFEEQKISFQYPRTSSAAKSIMQEGMKISNISSGIIIEENGELVGFTDKNGIIFSAAEVNAKIRFLQKNTKLEKINFGLTGFVAEGIKKNERGIPTQYFGFVVTETPRVRNGIVSGDVILGVENKTFFPQTIRQELYALQTTVIFHVLRQGKEIDVTVKK